MPVGPHVIPTSYTITDLDNVDHTLSITDCKKDLGIWITSTLCPSVQSQKAYAKAMQSLTTIKRSGYINVHFKEPEMVLIIGKGA